jgi:hypothetical protein
MIRTMRYKIFKTIIFETLYISYRPALILFIFFLLFLPGVISCRGRDAGSEPGGSSSRERAGGEKSVPSIPETTSKRPGRTLSFGAAAVRESGERAERAESGTATPEQNPSPSSEASGRGIPAESADDRAGVRDLRDLSRTRPFFEYAGTDIRYPADLVIGRLETNSAGKTETGKILALMESWIRGGLEKKNAKRTESYYTEASDRILRLRFSDFNFKIEEVRYGKIRFEDGTARLDIRIFSGKGRSSGTVVLRLEGREWKIQAVDVDFSTLGREYKAPDYVKNPTVYGTMQM